MISIHEKENTVFVIAQEKLNDDDYDKMLPLLRKKIETYDQINWYFQMKNFNGWTFNAFWRDMQFDVRNKDHLNKVAIVGENKWHKVMAEMMKPFTNAQIRYFDDAEEEDARQWVVA